MKTLMFYFAFEVFSIIFAILAQKNLKKEYKKQKGIITKSRIKFLFFTILSMLPLIVLVGFRSKTVGADTQSYIYSFFDIAKGAITSSDWLGIGFVTLCKLIGLISTDTYLFYNLILGGITIYFIYKAIVSESESIPFSLYIFFSTCLFYQTFNQARQMVAIALIFYGFKFILNNDFKKYLLFVILATLIHSSAIIMLPFYFLAKLKINNKKLIIYLLVILGSLVLSPLIVKILTLTSYGKIYMNSGYFTFQVSSLMKFAFGFCTVIACLFFNKFTKEKLENESISKLFNLCIWYVILQSMAVKIYILGRISVYLYMAFLLLIPNIYKEIIDNKIKLLFSYGVIFVYLIYHIFYFNSVAAASKYTDYKFIFE